MAWWNPFKKHVTQPQPVSPDHKTAGGVSAPPAPAKKETKEDAKETAKPAQEATP